MKLQRWAGYCLTGVTLFPGIRAGASLKAKHPRLQVLERELFPGIRAGASLKVRNPGGADGPSTKPLPRHSCRGLIEGRSTLPR